jgi:hypothetical protein
MLLDDHHMLSSLVYQFGSCYLIAESLIIWLENNNHWFSVMVIGNCWVLIKESRWVSDKLEDAGRILKIIWMEKDVKIQLKWQ